MGDLDEKAALGSSLGVDGHGGADVASCLDILAGLCGDGEVDGGVREGAGVRGGEEVLDQGAEAVEFVGGGVPAEQGLAGGGLEDQGEHVLLVFDIDLDLVLLLGMGDGEARANLDFGSIFGAGAYQGANDPGGLGVFTDISSNGVIEDGEDSLATVTHQPMNLFLLLSPLFFMPSLCLSRSYIEANWRGSLVMVHYIPEAGSGQ